MRILLLTEAFNGLTQRLFSVLRALGHSVSVEFDIADAVTLEAVAMFQPDVVIAPYLKRRIPEALWSRRVCLVVHPGPPGDRGPASLDWALLEGCSDWGVTVLQAAAEFDAGAVWAWRPLALRPGATKSSSYRREVSDAAVAAVLEALDRFDPAQPLPRSWPVLPAAAGGWRPLVTRAQRAVDWARDDTATVLARARSADGAPGATGTLFGVPVRLYDLHPAQAGGAPGTVLARRGPALCVATADGAVWVGHVRRLDRGDAVAALKLAATEAFADAAAALPDGAVPLQRDAAIWDELHYSEDGPPGARVGWLAFDFHNGAMSERQALRLLAALRQVQQRDTQVLVLAGGAEFFSNGIHLHAIEAAAHRAGDSAADASMRHIEAIDDVVLQILQDTRRLTVSALRGSAGAGGCFVALAADLVWTHAATVLNPHYKNMGNLYGSEYWTYTLPRRIGHDAAQALMQRRLPTTGAEAAANGLVDACFGDDALQFEALAWRQALALASAPGLQQRIAAKAAQRAADEQHKPLAAYRAEELQRMRRSFYGFDPSYHVARHHFVHRKPHAWTPRHLALHR